MMQKFIGVQDIDIVYWTLAIELAFYFWMAVLFATGQLKRIVMFSAIWLTASAVWAIAKMYGDVPDFYNTYLILEHIPYFITGIMFRKIYMDGFKIQYMLLLLFTVINNALISGFSEVIATVVLYSVFTLTITGRMKFLNNPALVWLGFISYPLYVIHRSIGYNLLQLLHDYGVSSIISVPIMMLLAIAVASTLTVLYEQPTITWLKKQYKKSRIDIGR